MHTRSLNRRHTLIGLTFLAATPALAQSSMDATTLGVTGDGGQDQSAALKSALDQAAASGRILRLPAGRIDLLALDIPGNLVIEGVPGRTMLAALPGGSGIAITGRASVVLRDIGFVAAPLSIQGSEDVALERCSFSAVEIGVAIGESAVTVRDCRFSDIGDAAIHSMDSRGLLIAANRIENCGNAGIRIWRSESGVDGSIVTDNQIDWRGGGNGQNGNGINVFKADAVIVSGNHIADCAFSAVRLNTTNNTQVSGNTCLRSGEVAIFSEFEFSGSIIANNIVDGAATGISITNLDVGGYLAVCAGNLVRNITPTSAVNPDTIPIGIFAEADAAITGNTVHNVPGLGIAAGYGTFLRNVLISGNVVSDADYGIGVSVVDGAGVVQIGTNMVTAREHDVVGLAWTEVVETDLLANSERYPNVRLGG